MSLKLRLRTKAEKLAEIEPIDHQHSFSHWLLVIFGTFLTSTVFGLVGFLLLFSGWVFFRAEVSLLSIVIGLPFILVGISVALINAYQILASIFDRRYSRQHCPLC